MQHPSRPTTHRAAPAALRRATLAAAVTAATALAGCDPAPAEGGPSQEDEAADAPLRELIHPEGASALPVFTPAVRVRGGDLLFLSGQIGTRPGTLELVEGGIAAETRQTLENVRGLLDAAGARWQDLVKCTVFLADIAEYGAMNEVYLEFFPDGPPARSAMAGSGLALGARVEIECIAAVR